MARDRAIAESAKQRSLRVPLDYLARRDPLARAKWWLSLVSAVVALGYVAWLLLDERTGGRHASPGEVARVHASWNDDCRACHLDFRPLRSDALDLLQLVGFGKSHDDTVAAHRAALDQACIKCHDEPPHQTSAKADEVATCAACHREHGGAGAAIIRPADSQCTACHADIDQHRDGSSQFAPPLANITGFGPPPSSGKPPHPRFRSLEKDPGNIKFNHWLHMQPGVAVADARHKLPTSDLAPEFLSQYAQFSAADGLVQLDCSACHSASSRGDYMQPVAYEQHCRACHPLPFALADDDGPTEELPHGLPAARLAVILDGLLLAEERAKAGQPEKAPAESEALPLFPGKAFGQGLAHKLGQDALHRREKAGAAVATRCQQCHFPDRAANAEAAGGLIDVLPASVPAQWLAHGRFDHSSHRHVECRTCHAAAYAFEKRDKPQVLSELALPAGYSAARDDEQVMISDLESCATCHAPRRGTNGGARHDCAECHAYHGRGSSAPSASFPGSALGTHQPEAPASSVGPLATHLVAHFMAAEPQQPDFLGAATCASFGCHGDVRPAAGASRSAFSAWLARDPHAEAYAVLGTPRGREMTRLLSPRSAASGQPRPLTNEQHARVLQERCLGCHATPSPTGQADTANYALGVACESCHGSAEGWLYTHYRDKFDRLPSSGFVDTKNLADRASACLPCHVGPNDAAGTRQVVDHDLIAAGHPRLNFELRTYFQQLPVHWDQREDERRHEPHRHYRLWRAGDEKQAVQLAALAQPAASADTGLPDFALLDCAACHHALGTSNWRQRTGLTVLADRRPLPGFASLPPIAPPPGGADPRALVAWAGALLATAANPAQATTHDQAVRGYLALRAVVADLSRTPAQAANPPLAALKTALDNLGHYLSAECYGVRPGDLLVPSLYDLPANYDPAQLAQRLQPVRAALQQLAPTLASPIREP